MFFRETFGACKQTPNWHAYERSDSQLVLFRLNRFDVSDQVVDVLLPSRIMKRIERPKTGVPHGHVVRSVRSGVPVKLQRCGYPSRRVLALMASSEGGQIRRWRLQRDCCWAVSLAVLSMA